MRLKTLFAVFLALTLSLGLVMPSELMAQTAKSDTVKVDSTKLKEKSKTSDKDKFIDRDGDGVNDTRKSESYTNGVIRAVIRKSKTRRPTRPTRRPRRRR